MNGIGVNTVLFPRRSVPSSAWCSRPLSQVKDVTNRERRWVQRHLEERAAKREVRRGTTWKRRARRVTAGGSGAAAEGMLLLRSRRRYRSRCVRGSHGRSERRRRAGLGHRAVLALVLGQQFAQLLLPFGIVQGELAG